MAIQISLFVILLVPVISFVVGGLLFTTKPVKRLLKKVQNKSVKLHHFSLYSR